MLHELLKPTLESAPDRPVMEFAGRFWTAAEVEEMSNRVASGLMRLGIESMDRVAVLLPNCHETVFTYLACFKANLVIVPLDYRHQPAQIRYALNHSGANVLIVHGDRIEELEQEKILEGIDHVLNVRRCADGICGNFDDLLTTESDIDFPTKFNNSDLSVMIYTSGTTSRPKGVTLTRGAMVAGVKKYLARVSLGSGDVALIAAPITRPMALRSQLLPVLRAGGCVSLIERFNFEEYVAALRRPPSKTFLALLPAALWKVMSHPDLNQCDFSKLRICMSGGDSVPDKLHEAFRDLTGISITEQCGQSEVGPYALNPPFGRKKQGSIGLPMYGSQVCVVDCNGDDLGVDEVGEIVVSSPLMMDGYWNDTALTRKTMQGGWVRTGDLGRFDDDGYLWFMGRKKDVIVLGGSNVSPMEVESILINHPNVCEACVIGVPDLDTEVGEEVHAFITSQCVHEPVTETELREYAGNLLADYMVPKKFHFVDELPRKGPGKTDRDRLRIRAASGVENY